MKTKKDKIVSLLASIGLILMVFVATYAYFYAKGDSGKITDVEVTANTVDVFTFEMGDMISFSLDQENFASGKGNLMGETFAKATLSANNKTNIATEHYYLYLCILNNEFEYSKSEEYPEIILNIKDQDNNEITEIEGLNYIDNLGGFDITDKQGTIMILDNREIIANNFKEDNWTATITFVNHDFNQARNAGKSFKARLKISKVVTHIVTLKLNNATSQEVESIVSAQSDSSFEITENDGYKFASYTCTNGQNGDFNNGVFTVEDVCADTTCTVNYVPLLTTSETTEYDTTRKYKVRIYGTTEDGLVGDSIYTGDDWTYNDFLNAYEKEYYFNETVTLPDPSDMFEIDGYVDNNNFTRISKEIDGYFVIIPVYPSVNRGIFTITSIRNKILILDFFQ